MERKYLSDSCCENLCQDHSVGSMTKLISLVSDTDRGDARVEGEPLACLMWGRGSGGRFKTSLGLFRFCAISPSIVSILHRFVYLRIDYCDGRSDY